VAEEEEEEEALVTLRTHFMIRSWMA
jgi:hypothetical protein